MAQRAVLTIGVPTFRRPLGLRRTLECLLAQTFDAFVIVVSDNCSEDPAVAEVCAEFAAADPRIRYVLQPRPLGITENFRWLLREADTPFFMWAADDDEWEPDFVSACMRAAMASGGSAMTLHDVRNRSNGTQFLPRQPIRMVEARNRADAVSAFARCMSPCMFYGVHRRDQIQFFLSEPVFDFYDCFFVLKVICERGFSLVPRVLFHAGIDSPEYVLKPVEGPRRWGSGLRYSPFVLASTKLILRSDFASLVKLRLLLVLWSQVARALVSREIRTIARQVSQFRKRRMGTFGNGKRPS